MRNEITFKEINGRKIPKIHGGRNTDVIKDKKRYSRKIKHKKND